MLKGIPNHYEVPYIEVDTDAQIGKECWSILQALAWLIIMFSLYYIDKNPIFLAKNFV